MDVSTDEICLQASGEAGHLLGKFIWSLNEANHILDFSKLFSEELAFISPGVLISFIYHVICYLWSGGGFFILSNSNSIIEKL